MKTRVKTYWQPQPMTTPIRAAIGRPRGAKRVRKAISTNRNTAVIGAKPATLPIAAAIGLIMGFGCQYLFTRVFVVDLPAG